MYWFAAYAVAIATVLFSQFSRCPLGTLVAFFDNGNFCALDIRSMRVLIQNGYLRRFCVI